MNTNSGVSHVIAALLAMVSGRILVEYMKPWLPSIIGPMEQMAARAEVLVASELGIHFKPGTFVPIGAGLILAFLWGLFHRASGHGQ